MHGNPSRGLIRSLIHSSGSSSSAGLLEQLESRWFLSGDSLGSVVPTDLVTPDAEVVGPDALNSTPVAYGSVELQPVPRGTALPNRIFYPEGWRNDTTINEYVPMVNPNAFEVQFQVIARYEVGERDAIISQGVIPANSRGGITISEHAHPENALVRLNEGYALEIVSSAPIGATLSHYDSFTNSGGTGAAVGEAFTSDTSSEWFVADASNISFDFLLFYNPNNTPLALNIVFYDEQGASHNTTWSVDPLRRSGLAVRDPDLSLPANEHFGVFVQEATGQQFLTCLSSYSATADEGFTNLVQQLGVSDYPFIEFRDGVENSLTLFNPSTDAIDVRVRMTFVGSAAAATDVTHTLASGQRLVLDLNAGRPQDATGASVYVRGGYVQLQSVDHARGDSTVETPIALANTMWAFSDGFLDSNTAGTVGFEMLGLFNPRLQAQDVHVRYLFTDGTFQERTVSVGALASTRIQLDQDPLILNHAQLNFYSIVVTSAQPVAASMIHWDLFQGGGWASIGTPLGSAGPG